MFKTSFLNAYPDMQFDYEDWMKMTNRFSKDITDSVLEDSSAEITGCSLIIYDMMCY